MKKLSQEQQANLLVLDNLINAKKTEITVLKNAYQALLYKILTDLGLDPNKEYELLPDGRIFEVYDGEATRGED